MTTLAILGVVVTPLNEIGKCLFGAPYRQIKCQIKYLTGYNANIEKLRSQVGLLKQKQAYVKTLVEAAERRLYVPSEEVKEWLEITGRTIEDDMRTFEEVEANKACLKGMCPDLISRLKLSKKATMKLEAIDSLVQQQGHFTEASIAHPRPPASVELVRTSSIVDNLPLRDKVMEDVMEALGNDSIRSIGVHGMGGIGKTTFVDKINNALQGSRLFKKVIKVVVSKEPNLNIIQDNIADRLGLNLKEVTSTAVRANRLFERLAAEESVLIILDDLWEKLNVVAIGIPVGSECIGCKIMLTTRDLNICKQMNIKKTIKLEPLSEDESWVLFETKAGDEARSSNLKPIAQEIVRRCKGSPLAIATLGSTLTTVKEEYVWEDALRVLKNPTRSGLKGIMQEVVESISFSYEHLHSQEIKLCFLFCCLFPEDYNIDLLELRDYGVGEGFLSVNETLEEASNKLLSFVKKLKDCGLLLEGDDCGLLLEGDDPRKCSVKMHDVVRDVAIAIASDDENGFLVSVGRPLRNSQETEKLKGYKRMSFMKNGNLVLPDPPLECPQLHSLLIKENASVSNEESCFEGMKSLVVLDVSIHYERNLVARAPLRRQNFATVESLRCLSNLRTLYLVKCDLSNKVSLLGGLRELIILRLRGSEIGRLPEEIGNLSNLMCLDLTDAKLSIVAPNVISRLSNLEELYMVNGYSDWDQVGRGDEPNASLAEVASLNHLSILRIGIRVETPLDMQFHWWNNLKEFHVIMEPDRYEYVQRPYLSYDSSSSCSTLKISGVSLEHWVNKLLSIPKVRVLKLEKCVGIKKVFSSNLLLDAKRLQNLEEISVSDCKEVEEVFNTEEESRETPPPPMNMMQLSRPMKLHLSGLPKLTSIWKGVVPIGSLQHLKEVTLTKCDSLEYLSSYSSAVALESVVSIYIKSCDGMKKLIVSNREKEEGEGGANSSKFTISPPPPTFPNLQFLQILKCGNLKSLFSFTMARNLQQLRKLKVEWCRNLEEIIAKEEEEEEEVEHQYFLPRLQELYLEGCENLTSIIHGNLPITCPLKTIRVLQCPNLKKLPLQQQTASYLETIYGTTEWLQGLESEDESLRSVLQKKFKLEKLEGISESDCEGVEEVFNTEESRETTPPPMNMMQLSRPMKLHLHEEEEEEEEEKESREMTPPPMNMMQLSRPMKLHLHEEEEEESRETPPPPMNMMQLSRPMKLHLHEEEEEEEEEEKESRETTPPPMNMMQLSRPMKLHLHEEEEEEESPETPPPPMNMMQLSRPMKLHLHEEEEEEEEEEEKESRETTPPPMNMMQLSRPMKLHLHEEEEESRETPPPPMNMMQLSKPMKLHLHELPKLTSIWKGVVPIGSLQHLKELTLAACDSLEYLSSYSSAVALESVEIIHISSCNGMKKLIVSNREKEEGEGGANSSKFTIAPPPTTFPNLQFLKIFQCGNLKSLFSFTMARNLQQLRQLQVDRCRNLEQIIAKEEEEEEEVEHQYFLPRLHKLHLVGCRNLTSIIHGNLPITCPLKTIIVGECPNLKKLPLQQQTASSLETIYLEEIIVYDCKELEEVFNTEES